MSKNINCVKLYDNLCRLKFSCPICNKTKWFLKTPHIFNLKNKWVTFYTGKDRYKKYPCFKCNLFFDVEVCFLEKKLDYFYVYLADLKDIYFYNCNYFIYKNNKIYFIYNFKKSADHHIFNKYIDDQNLIHTFNKTPSINEINNVIKNKYNIIKLFK